MEHLDCFFQMHEIIHGLISGQFKLLQVVKLVYLICWGPIVCVCVDVRVCVGLSKHSVLSLRGSIEFEHTHPYFVFSLSSRIVASITCLAAQITNRPKLLVLMAEQTVL